MSYAGASLADGSMTTLGTLYSVPSGKTAIIRSFTVFNTNSTSETVQVYVTRKGSTARQIGIAVLAQDESKEFISMPITLSSEDKITGETTSSADYLITGAIE